MGTETGVKILIVEDNANNRLLLKAVLTYYGYAVLEAANGEEGLRLAREEKPGLIIMDIQMRVMDGITAVKALKADPSTKNIKTIAVTSYAMKGDRENFLDAGFDGYLAKPIDTRQLPETIKHYLANNT
ncbi:MAG: response regulator [Nitrospirae bacterium]|nr:response regulator [Nitrospirota bacterium]